MKIIPFLLLLFTVSFSLPDEMSFIISSYACTQNNSSCDFDPLDECGDFIRLYNLNSDNPKIQSRFTSENATIQIIENTKKCCTLIHNCGSNHFLSITIYYQDGIVALSYHTKDGDGPFIISGIGDLTIDKKEKKKTSVVKENEIIIGKNK